MKERTLRGVHSGRTLVVGFLDGVVTLTLWDGLLLLKRNLPPEYPFVRRWRGRVLVGGRFWRELPHPLQRNPTVTVYYPDTLLDALTWLIRPWLVPGMAPHQRAWRRVRYGAH